MEKSVFTSRGVDFQCYLTLRHQDVLLKVIRRVMFQPNMFQSVTQRSATGLADTLGGIGFSRWVLRSNYNIT